MQRLIFLLPNNSKVFKIIDNIFIADVTIVGSGLAGLSTIYFLDLLNKEKAKIAIISKSSLGYGTSTYYSAGVFRCPVNGYSIEEYIRDFIEGGRYINKKSLVGLIASESISCVNALKELGLKFEVSRGSLRVVSSDPLFPGKELIAALRSYVLNRSNTILLENTYMLDIVRNSNGSLATVCITSRGSYVIVNSRVVVLATGGAANVFIRSDNPQQLTCDGHGACLRLGIPLIDMEFIQFFPLGIAEPGKPSFMIPFAKGKLVNRLGEDIVMKYGLESLDKAVGFNRDKLSRYIMLEIMNGNGVNGALHMYLEENIDELSLFANELRRKLNLKSPIKVLPIAHFSMGGVEVDENLETSINGLYIAGELVGGVHGANRLGGNALTTCIVTAKIVAKNILTYIDNRFREKIGMDIEDNVKHILNRYRLKDGKYIPSEVRSSIRNIMWLKAGVIRSEDLIKECIGELLDIYENLDKIRISSHDEVVRYSETLNTLLTSLAVAYSALIRKESRGAHFRLDYPEESNSWVKNIRIIYKDDRFRYEVI